MICPQWRTDASTKVLLTLLAVGYGDLRHSGVGVRSETRDIPLQVDMYTSSSRSIYIFFYFLSIYLSMNLSINLSIHRYSIYLSHYSTISIYSSLFFYLSIYISIYISIYPFIHIYPEHICLFIDLFFTLSLNHTISDYLSLYLSRTTILPQEAMTIDMLARLKEFHLSFLKQYS